MALYEVTAWEVKSPNFNGYVYTQQYVIDILATAEYYEVTKVTLMRDHEPMPHMTYKLVQEDDPHKAALSRAFGDH